MPIIFDRRICCDLKETITREWLITNGLGGYAAGTVAGTLTRMQHGLLAAIPSCKTVPYIFLAKIDEEVVFDQRTYYLGTNEYRDGTLNPAGFVHLESFRLEEGFPVFTFRLGGISGITLEKRIWQIPGHNTTYIQYRLFSTETTAAYEGRMYGMTGSGHSYERTGPAPDALTLTLLPFSTARPFNQWSSAQQPFRVRVYPSDLAAAPQPGLPFSPHSITGCTVESGDEKAHTEHRFHIMAVSPADSQTTCIPTGAWYWNFLHRQDAAAGIPATDHLYLPVVIRTTLTPGTLEEPATVTILSSTEDLSTLVFHPAQLDRSYKECIARQHMLLRNAVQPQRYFGEGGEAARAAHLRVLPLTTTSDPYEGGEQYLRHLLQASDRFVAQRKLPHDDAHNTHEIFFGKPESALAIYADYFSLETRLRDALIALPGLLLVPERYNEALRFLRECARHFRGGLLPDRLVPNNEPLQEHEYRGSDTTLWYFYALDHYLRVTRNYQVLEEFYPQLTDCINRFVQGTAKGICVDAEDGLLQAMQANTALTWMNATVNGQPVTPRSGKPVEVNALWSHALSLMYEWSHALGGSRASRHGYDSSYYHQLLSRCKESFQRRFWYEQGGYLYDCLDGPQGDDRTIRPNQLFALSLRYPVLDAPYRQSVFDVVTQHLLTPYGLRTLSPRDPAYRGQLGRTHDEQQRALHQGSSWVWLIAPYIEAMFSTQGIAFKQCDKLFHEYLWRKGLLLLEPFKELLSQGMLGMTGSLFDGTIPQSRSASIPTSAISTGELLRSYHLLAHMRVASPEPALVPGAVSYN